MAAVAAANAVDRDQNAGDKDGLRNFEAPPIWNGVEPARNWKRCRQEARKWHMETDVADKKHGLRFCRSLRGDAKLLIELSLNVEDINGADGFGRVMKCFDVNYSNLVDIRKELAADGNLTA